MLSSWGYHGRIVADAVVVVVSNVGHLRRWQRGNDDIVAAMMGASPFQTKEKYIYGRCCVCGCSTISKKKGRMMRMPPRMMTTLLFLLG
jgi:hypothetical protein